MSFWRLHVSAEKTLYRICAKTKNLPTPRAKDSGTLFSHFWIVSDRRKWFDPRVPLAIAHQGFRTICAVVSRSTFKLPILHLFSYHFNKFHSQPIPYQSSTTISFFLGRQKYQEIGRIISA